MPAPFTVIDATTDGVWGPFDTLREAHECADAFPRFEIVDETGALVEWNTRLPRPPADTINNGG